MKWHISKQFLQRQARWFSLQCPWPEHQGALWVRQPESNRVFFWFFFWPKEASHCRSSWVSFCRVREISTSTLSGLLLHVRASGFHGCRAMPGGRTGFRYREKEWGGLQRLPGSSLTTTLSMVPHLPLFHWQHSETGLKVQQTKQFP